MLGNGRENFTDNVRVTYVVKQIPKRYNSFVSSIAVFLNLCEIAAQ